MANTAGQGTFAIDVDPVEFKSLIAVLRSLDKEQSARVREAAFPLSQRLAGQLHQFAMVSPTPQTRLVAQSINPRRDRLIRVEIGGKKAVGRPYRSREEKLKSGKGKTMRAPAGALLWGSEYGSTAGTDSRGRTYTNRFKVGRNRGGYWINPAVDYYAPIVAREYAQMLTEVIKENRLD
jgi:hypothetical protein